MYIVFNLPTQMAFFLKQLTFIQHTKFNCFFLKKNYNIFKFLFILRKMNFFVKTLFLQILEANSIVENMMNKFKPISK